VHEPIKSKQRYPTTSGAAPVLPPVDVQFQSGELLQEDGTSKVILEEGGSLLLEGAFTSSWLCVYPNVIVRPINYPASIVTGPVLVISTEVAGTDSVSKLISTTVIQSRQRWPYVGGATSVFTPEIPPPNVIEIDKWSPHFEDRIDRDQLHAAYIPYLSNWNPATPTPNYSAWLANYPAVVTRRFNLSYLVRPTRDNVPFQVQISPDMWSAVYPNKIWNRAPLTPATQTISQRPPDVFIPQSSSWKGAYPDFVRRYPPLYHLVPSWFGPDSPRPNLAEDIDRFTWFTQHPDFARGYPPLAYLSAFYRTPEWWEETLPEKFPWQISKVRSYWIKGWHQFFFANKSAGGTGTQRIAQYRDSRRR